MTSFRTWIRPLARNKAIIARAGRVIDTFLPDAGFSVRTMTRSDLDRAVEWAASECWNPGWHDADTFYATDPNGFFMACRDGEPVGCISAVAYDDSFGFVGFYIVRPECRGRRIGLELGRRAFVYLDQRNIGQDGVEAKIRNYEFYGFKLAYRNMRFAGQTARLPFDDSAVVPVSEVAFEEWLSYDKALFPVERRTFLEHWLCQRDSVALGLKDDHGVRGYGVIRPCRTGFKIGPLFADTAEEADILYRALLAQVPENEPVFLDIPEVNTGAVALVERYAMKKVFQTARMYTDGAPGIDTDRIYGVTTFELG